MNNSNRFAYPVKIWTEDVELEAAKQIKNISSLPFIHSHVAVMPDCHAGKGSTIGTVIPTINAIIPAAVGVDIGCGMMACKLSIKSKHLPDNLSIIRNEFEKNIPHGRSNNGGSSDKGSWKTIPDSVLKQWTPFEKKYSQLTEKYPKSKSNNAVKQLGTLGTGNHFIELCIDENDEVWIMLHSGSRGLGNRFGTFFIEMAKNDLEKRNLLKSLPDSNLAYLEEDTELFNDYILAVKLAQNYALTNRGIMMRYAIDSMQKIIPGLTLSLDNECAVNCHHNYVSVEYHFGKDVYVTRKGAISAYKNELGIIPGSMGAKSYIVKGLGNKDSFCSSSHGAGRKMSRTEAKRLFTVDDLKSQTVGIECPKDISRIDEIPSAYKDIDVVMNNQKDLVEIVHSLKQIVNVKG